MATSADLAGARGPVRLGILGAGRAVRGYHIPAIQALPELFAITAVCDVLKDRRDTLGGIYPDAQLYRRERDIFDDPNVDVVLVATPSSNHEEHIRAALAQNKWVVAESPVAMSYEGAQLLKAAAQRARGRLLPVVRGLFEPEFLLAKRVRGDKRLGEIYSVAVRRSDYLRRDDWQSVQRCGGGAAWYAAPDALAQTIALIGAPPVNLWSDLKRIAATGDAEDFVQMRLKTRDGLTGGIDINGGRIPPFPPQIEIAGAKGEFFAEAGATEGTLRIIDPKTNFPRRRASVRTPDLGDRHEKFEVLDVPVALDAEDMEDVGAQAFWKAVYMTVARAAEFPVSLDDTVEIIRYLQIAKKSSPFAS
ncbi:MAG: Gfo/Idh/MocA family oxidoreductase [Kiritimatiellae bacterium]|nr:Gfo/Idh/MocA family oxidoreductase [Kiritimatiellia bacterium]